MSLVTPSHLQGGGDLLALLQNPEAVKQRLEQLQAAELRAQEIVALAGEAARIPQLLAEAEASREETSETAGNAKIEAEALIEQAKTDAETIRESAREEASKTVAEANAIAKQAEAISAGAKTEASVANREKEVLAARKSEYDRKDEALQQRADALEIQEQELTGEKTRLADLRDLIQKAL